MKTNVHFYYPEDCLPPTLVESDTSGSEPLPPYWPDARCDFICEDDGYYAAIELTPSVHQACVPCADNSIAVNGGYLIDFKMLGEDLYEEHIRSGTVKTDGRVYEVSDFWEPEEGENDPLDRRFFGLNRNCSSWAPTGRSLKTPQMSTYNETKQALSHDTVELAEYKLVMHETFLFKGSIEFRYRANAALINGYATPNGVFKFFIDGQDMRVVSDHFLQGQWITSKFDIPAGFHTLEWAYMKYLNLHGESHEDLAAEIEWMRVVGTQYTPLECTACGRGVSNEKHTKCEACPINSYLDDLDAKGGKCEPCPEGTYSHAGSYGVASCKQQKPCTRDDVLP